MERDSLKHSEFNPPSRENDSNSSTETDKKKRKKTQTDNERVWSRVNSSETKPEESKSKQTEALNTLWHRTIEETKREDSEHQPTTEETATENQLDHLSQSEVREVAEAYLTARRQEIAQELTGRPEEVASELVAQAALAADAYLAAVELKLRTEPNLDITNATDEAYYEAAQIYAPESLIQAKTDEAADMHPDDREAIIPLNELLGDHQEEDGGGSSGDNGREPPYWRRDAFLPNGKNPFSPSSPNTGGSLETIIERDFAAERVAAVRGLLVGGIIGYLIGRRRGRIRTEKRLIPIQKKLEREVQTLYSTISIKETQLRKSVFERNHSSNLTKPESFTRDTAALNYSQEGFPVNQKQPNLEALRSDKTQSAEIINPPNYAGEAVNRKALLEAGEKIRVGSTTLSKVFETGLISERGLRRAVEEYMKGGDIRRVLAEEVLIKELGYELDPNMRDRPLKKTAKPLAASVSVNQPASNEQVATLVEERNDQLNPDSSSSLPPPIPESQRSIPSLLITANAIALIILGILLLILLITHK
jgi:hypothetical protein